LRPLLHVSLESALSAGGERLSVPRGRRAAIGAAMMALAALLATSVPVLRAQGSGRDSGDLDAASQRRLAEELGTRRVAEPTTQRGDGPDFRALFRGAVGAVPFVVTTSGSGSGVVLDVGRRDTGAWVVTNHHVVERPFRTRGGDAVVVLLFYEPDIANAPADPAKLVSCFEPQSAGDWCNALRGSMRLGQVVGADPGRDLAVIRVRDLPARIAPLRAADLGGVQPGDVVAAIGHPEGFLWSLTTGIVSAVRSKFRMGETDGTVIQTQAPVWHGNSGGPLLTGDGRVVGVVSWGLSRTQGFNMAIAINEVQSFATALTRDGRR
jgi:S1-C subfamily serine protease